jgi:hypothetical protein
MLTKRCATLAVAWLSLATLPPVFGQEKQASEPKASEAAGSAEKIADIRRLMEISGAKAGVDRVVGAMVDTILLLAKNQASPNAPEEIWEEFRKELTADKLLELNLPLWDKHFTHEEIREYIKFYQTPAGRKLAATQPILAEEGMARGRVYGQEVMQKILDRLRSKGLLKKT